MKLAVGNSDFKDLRTRGCDFVDKTLFIQEVLNSVIQTFLIARPRRFGKTFNLSLLRYFFDIRDAVENRRLFEDTLIAKATLDDGITPCMNFQGRFPVLFLTLKSLRAQNYEEMYAKITQLLSELYEEHRYLLDSDKMRDMEKIIYQLVIDRKAKRIDLQFSLKNLIEYLDQFYNKKVMVLVDEYDTPMRSAFEAKSSYHKTLLSEFMSGFIGAAFKGNLSMERGILTGTLPVGELRDCSFTSSNDNIITMTTLSHHYSEYFGFTEAEVNELLSTAGLKHKSSVIKNWYRGYDVQGITLYNPESIIDCISKQGDLKPYWLESGEHGVLGKALFSLLASQEVYEQLKALLEDRSIEVELDERTIFANIEKNQEALWSRMLYVGYLKVVGVQNVEKRRSTSLSIPNKEVQRVFNEMIRHWGEFPSDGRSMHDDLVATIKAGDATNFFHLIKRYISEMASFHDFTHDTEERFYHACFLGSLFSLKDHYEVKSEPNAGFGRADIILIPRVAGERGMIIELKSIRVKDRREEKWLDQHDDERAALLSKTAMEALNQITKKEYRALMTHHRVDQAAHIGIAFYGKEMTYESENVIYSPELRPIAASASTSTGFIPSLSFFGEEEHRHKRPRVETKSIGTETMMERSDFESMALAATQEAAVGTDDPIESTDEIVALEYK